MAWWRIVGARIRAAWLALSGRTARRDIPAAANPSSNIGGVVVVVKTADGATQTDSSTRVEAPRASMVRSHSMTSMTTKESDVARISAVLRSCVDTIEYLQANNARFRPSQMATAVIQMSKTANPCEQ